MMVVSSAGRRPFAALAITLGACCALAISPGDAADPAATAPDQRKYSAGPLSPADFTMPPPKPLPKASGSTGMTALAQTFVEIHYTYGYRVEPRGQRREAFATNADLFATLARSHSWNAAPDNKRLLAHEQGHFDIGEIFAWRGQVRFDKLIAARGITASGATDEEALKALSTAVAAEFAKVIAEMQAEHVRYDADTRHGVDVERQSQWRRKFDEQLQDAAKGRALRKPPAEGERQE